jgi:hypothetical protein
MRYNAGVHALRANPMREHAMHSLSKHSDNQVMLAASDVAHQQEKVLSVYQTKHKQARMPLTAAQRTAFFVAADQMGIPQETVVQLQAEGIAGVEDLSDFDKETIEQIASNL